MARQFSDGERPSVKTMLAAAGIAITACDQVRRPREKENEGDEPQKSEPPRGIPASALAVDEPTERTGRNRNGRERDDGRNTSPQPEPREEAEQQADDS